MEDEKSMENVDVALATCSREQICYYNLDFDLTQPQMLELYEVIIFLYKF